MNQSKIFRNFENSDLKAGTYNRGHLSLYVPGFRSEFWNFENLDLKAGTYRSHVPVYVPLSESTARNIQKF